MCGVRTAAAGVAAGLSVSASDGAEEVVAQGALLAGEAGASPAADEEGKGEVGWRRKHHRNPYPVL